MKTIIRFLVVFFLSGAFSSLAHANSCPALSGSWHCTFENTQPEGMVVEQGEEEGVPFFILNGTKALIDGQIHPLPNSEELKDGVYKATCFEGQLEVWQKAQLTFATGTLEATLRLSLDSSGDIVLVNQGKLVIEDRERSLDNEGVCTRRL